MLGRPSNLNFWFIFLRWRLFDVITTLTDLDKEAGHISNSSVWHHFGKAYTLNTKLVLILFAESDSVFCCHCRICGDFPLLLWFQNLYKWQHVAFQGRQVTSNDCMWPQFFDLRNRSKLTMLVCRMCIFIGLYLYKDSIIFKDHFLLNF